MTELNGVKQDLATFKNNTSREMHEIKNVIRKIEESQVLLGKKYDTQQKKIHDLIEDNKRCTEKIFNYMLSLMI